MRGQLYRGTPTPRLCSVVQWSVHSAPSRTTRVLVLAGARRCALETCGKLNFLIIPDLVCQFTYYNLFLLHSNLYHLMDAYSCVNSISISRLLSDFTVGLQMDSVFLFVFSFWLVSRKELLTILEVTSLCNRYLPASQGTMVFLVVLSHISFSGDLWIMKRADMESWVRRVLESLDGGGKYSDKFFAGSLASQNTYPIIANSVAIYRPHLSHVW